MSKNLTDSLNNILRILDEKCTDAEGETRLDPTHLEAFSEESAYLKERMDLTPFQAILLALIIQTPEGRRDIRRIGDKLGMSYLSILSYSQDFFALRDKGLIYITNDKDIKVPTVVIDALMSDKPYEKPQMDGLSSRQIMRGIGMLMKKLSKGLIQQEQTLEEALQLIDLNKGTKLSQQVARHLASTCLSKDEQLLFFVLAHLYVN